MNETFKKSQNILLVDDSRTNILILSELLSEFGYNIFKAYSGKEAIEILINNKIDLILLDVIMPGMDGFEVCLKIKQNENLKNISVVFLTALTDLESIEKGFDCGAIDYITKPFKAKEVIARIKTHLELNSYRTYLEELVHSRTLQLEKINVKLENEIEQKSIIAQLLQNHKEQLEEIVRIRTRELQESEIRFRTIFDKNGSIMLVINPETGQIVDANETAINFYGFSSEILKNKFIFEINTLTNEEIKIELSKAITNQQNLFSFKHKLVTGEIKDVEVYAIPIILNGCKYLISSIYDVTEKKQIQNKILNTIIETEEKEKQRFAKDLHDGLGPILSTSKLYLKSLEQNCNNECEKNNKFIIHKIDEIINEAIISIKEISNHLSPHILTNFGFVTAIKSITKKIENSSSIVFSIFTNAEIRFVQNIETSAYRIVLELINNTIKHANATQIEITINLSDDFLKIDYVDNGIGFDIEKVVSKKNGMGLQNIQSRIKSLNGNIEIITKVNFGFKAFFYIPLKPE
jgi:PAS domain S-box-containing protein